MRALSAVCGSLCCVLGGVLAAQPVLPDRKPAGDAGTISTPRPGMITGDFRQLWPRLFWREKSAYAKALASYRIACSVPLEVTLATSPGKRR